MAALKYEVDKLDGVDAAFHSLYTQSGEKFILTGVEGVKPQGEFDKVYGGLTKERNDHKESKAKLQAWSALGTAEEVQAKLDRIAELETAAGGNLDEAAIEKLVSGRLVTKTAPLERTIAKLTADLAERDGVIGQYKTKDTTRAIHDNLRTALSKHEGFQQSAFDDAAMLAERMFTVDEDGRVVTKEGVGVTPGVDATVWLTEMQTKRPHWWGPSQGGGAGGNRGTTGVPGSNPFSKDGWNMTEQSKLVQSNRARAEQMARSAGTTIGGTRPLK